VSANWREAEANWSLNWLICSMAGLLLVSGRECRFCALQHKARDVALQHCQRDQPNPFIIR
jgi:hypothetical protein